MKTVSSLLKVFGSLFAMISFIFFASDYIPIDYLNFGSFRLTEDQHLFFKVVPTGTGESASPLLYSGLFGFLSLMCFITLMALKKHVED